jgi:Tol biopolymer transport system component
MEGDPRFSPDGRWIAYSSDESGRREVYIRPFQGGDGKWQVSTEGGRDPQWRGDGKELFYLHPNGRIYSVSVESGSGLALGTPTLLFTSVAWDPDGSGGNYDVAPDGQRFLIRRAVVTSALPATTVFVNWLEAMKRR